MLGNRGKWQELPEQCKKCEHMRVFSLHMDGNHNYCCAKYPLKDSNAICPKFEKKCDLQT